MVDSIGALSLVISLVSYRPVPQLLLRTLASLHAAVEMACLSGILGRARLIVVDNDSDSSLDGLLELSPWAGTCEVMRGQGNVGFGRGHNMGLAGVETDLVMILNPDAELAEDALVAAIEFIAQHPEIGLLVPDTLSPDGNRQYLCKRYPSVLDLLLRGFAPACMLRAFRVRLKRYELRDEIDVVAMFEPPIVSGCCMLFRSGLFKQLRGFDERYFLYFEDFDLSLRAGKLTRIAWFPGMRIVHHGGHAARKGWRHVAMFVRSGITFFNTHGWKWW